MAKASHTKPHWANPSVGNGFPPPGHNHVRCVQTSLTRAASAFETRKAKFTDLRRTVFAEIAASHHAIGAYDIIHELARKGTRLAPISVYRAIDALIAAGVVHRLESRNAYFACHADHSDARQTLILACEDCGAIAEVEAHDTVKAIDAIAGRHQFAIAKRMTELTGRCAHCAGRRQP